jgi:ankyrin repeat protein
VRAPAIEVGSLARGIVRAPIGWLGATAGSRHLRRRTATVVGTAILALITVACDNGTAPVSGVSPTTLEAAPAETAKTKATATGAEATVATTTVPAPGVEGERDMNLIIASERGDLNEVNQLLAQGAGVNARDGRGRTALIAAAYGNHLEVARVLIEAGADVNIKDSTQQSAYLIPTADGNLDMLRLTLQSGADVHSTDSYNGTGLIRAADRGHVEIIQELLQTPINVDHVNRLGWTALLEAIILGNGGPRHTEVVRLLVGAGANVNLADGNGVTPLTHARQRGFGEIIAILSSAGAR